MGTSIDDIKEDVAIEESFQGRSLDREKLLQCIYLLVEGATEEQALPSLLATAGADLDELGVVLVNMGGANNATHIVRTLLLTLSADRPVVLVLDNDDEGKRAANSSTLRAHPHLTTMMVPAQGVVELASGARGGSFEEMFDLSQVIEAVVEQLDAGGPSATDLHADVDPQQPWLAQISRICRASVSGFREIDKVEVAICLSSTTPAPADIQRLAALLTGLRDDNPVLPHHEAVDS